jgi:UDPglucose 6-dehydrogenase
MLVNAGANVKGYDPVSMDNARMVLDGVDYCGSAYEVAEGADAIVVVTDWNEFKHLDMARVKDLMRGEVVVDGRNIYNPDEMSQMGFKYRGFGRGYNGAATVEE